MDNYARKHYGFEEILQGIDHHKPSVTRPELGDSAGMHALLSDPETVKYWVSTPIIDKQISTDKLADYLDSDDKGESINWAVCRKNQSEMIGRCVFFHFDEANRRAEIGFILNRQYWRRGLLAARTR